MRTVICESCHCDYPESEVVGNVSTQEMFCFDCQDEYEGKVKQTEKIKCPNCKVVQEEDIHDLTVDAENMEGSFIHECDNCEYEFTVEYEYKPFIKTSK
jgi:hypothetical protein